MLAKTKSRKPIVTKTAQMATMGVDDQAFPRLLLRNQRGVRTLTRACLRPDEPCP